jgi:membrane protein YqaA with SNARE-associated domain
MLMSRLVAVALIWRWMIRGGGPGLVALGIADNSLIPLTGSTDVLTIWLAASQPSLWFYYAVMATIGAVLGGYITYALARKGGKEAIEHKFNQQKAEKIVRRFQRWGFWSVFTGAILPPPFPLVPVLLAAGAMQYPRRKFLSALSAGRGVRYSIIAGLGALYGNSIVAFFSRYYKPALLILVSLAVVGGLVTLFEYRRSRRKHSVVETEPQRKVA